MARSTPLLLALCLALAAAAASAAPIPPASRCGQVAAGMMGAWAETSTENVPAEAVAAIEIALIETANNELNSTWVPCDEPAVDIREACSQVVAGQNLELVLSLDCQDNSILVSSTVFVPLPNENADPQVTSLEVLGVDGQAMEPPMVVL